MNRTEVAVEVVVRRSEHSYYAFYTLLTTNPCRVRVDGRV